MHHIPFAESEIFVVPERSKESEINPDIEASKVDKKYQEAIPNLVTSSYQFVKKDDTTSGGLKIGKFVIDLYLEDSSLRIEAEHQDTGKLYSETFASEVITEKTSRWFNSTGELYDNLKLAIEGCDESLKVEISDQAVITLSIKVRFGPKEKILVYSFELKELNLSPLQVCTKYFEKLKEQDGDRMTPFNRQLLKVMQKVIEHNTQTEKELEQTLERVKLLEEKLLERNK